MLNFQDAVYQNSVLLTHAPPLGWVSFPRKTWVSFNYKSIPATPEPVLIDEGMVSNMLNEYKSHFPTDTSESRKKS